MAVMASVKLTQGFSTAPAGESLMGLAGTPVVATNGNDGGIVRWEWEMISVPIGSSVTVGLYSDGPISQMTFTPDIFGGYLLRLTVFDLSGNKSTDDRVFGVQETTGRFIPPFGSTNLSLNFSAQDQGWALYMSQWLKYLDTIAGGANISLTTNGRLHATMVADINFAGEVINMGTGADPDDLVNIENFKLPDSLGVFTGPGTYTFGIGLNTTTGVVVDASLGSVSVELPGVGTATVGKWYIVKSQGIGATFTVTVTVTGGGYPIDNIFAPYTKLVSEGDSAVFWFDGFVYRVLANPLGTNIWRPERVITAGIDPTPTTFNADDYIIDVNTTLGNMQINLPPGPVTAERVCIVKWTTTTGVFTLTVDGNGNTIEGDTTFTFQGGYRTAGDCVAFRFAAGEWKVLFTTFGDRGNVRTVSATPFAVNLTDHVLYLAIGGATLNFVAPYEGQEIIIKDATGVVGTGANRTFLVGNGGVMIDGVTAPTAVPFVDTQGSITLRGHNGNWGIISRAQPPLPTFTVNGPGGHVATDLEGDAFYYCNTNNNPGTTLTLPNAEVGRTVYVFEAQGFGGQLSVLPAAGDTINGAGSSGTFAANAGKMFKCQSNGNWAKIG